MTLRNSILRIVFLILGFLLAVFAVAWAIDLSSKGQLQENSVALFILLVVAIICLYAGKEME